MFKDLKIVKIIIFVVLFIFIVKEQISSHKSTEIIFKPIAYLENQEINFQITSNASVARFPLNVNNVVTNNTVLDTAVDVHKTYDYFDNVDFLTQGYKTETIAIQNNFTSGIYVVNKKHPFIVKSEEAADITVVVPLMNKHFYTPSNEQRIFESDSSFISEQRSVVLDQWTKGLAPFFSKIEQTYTVNYVSDLDLEHSLDISKTKLLVLYGRLIFWSPLMMKNVKEFLERGGKLLIASSDIFYAKFCYDQIKGRFQVSGCSEMARNDDKLQSWKGKVDSCSELYTMINSNFGGKNIGKGEVYINELSHPVFKGGDMGNITKVLGSAAYLVGGNPYCFYQKIVSVPCEKKDGADKTGGVFEFKQQNNPQIFVFGSSDYCLKDKQQTLLPLFVNAVNYLLASKV
ncbi:MAG: hypothetical protein N4A35_14510 [Flavobacteriales bacterium]|jgi:hypothetical protein|nr:hypothetical protein [Flavobacteriales bacterium]